jgi:UDP-N-acetyl-2-amino-2-deoxyglucuronate dehydrogenase
MNKNFALIGAAGYIAPRHMKAITETKNNLLAAMDPSDSVGIIDSYFPEAKFFTEFERFDRHIEKLKYDEKLDLDYVSICSPNYLHDAHIRFSLRSGANAICEKPLVLNPWNIDKLQKVEENTGKKIFNVLQLRVHPSIIELRKSINQNTSKKKKDIILTYLTSRGAWYHSSWKGDIHKSGGLASNIGIHFFDMLGWLFGSVQKSLVFKNTSTESSGYLELEDANVRWYLSIDKTKLPKTAVNENKTTYRSITIDGNEIEFSGGFGSLHTLVYQDILSGKGYGITDARQAVEIAEQIRTATISSKSDMFHPILTK